MVQLSGRVTKTCDATMPQRRLHCSEYPTYWRNQKILTLLPCAKANENASGSCIHAAYPCGLKNCNEQDTWVKPPNSQGERNEPHLTGQQDIFSIPEAAEESLWEIFVRSADSKPPGLNAILDKVLKLAANTRTKWLISLFKSVFCVLVKKTEVGLGPKNTRPFKFYHEDIVDDDIRLVFRLIKSTCMPM